MRLRIYTNSDPRMREVYDHFDTGMVSPLGLATQQRNLPKVPLVITDYGWAFLHLLLQDLQRLPFSQIKHLAPF